MVNGVLNTINSSSFRGDEMAIERSRSTHKMVVQNRDISSILSRGPNFLMIVTKEKRRFSINFSKQYPKQSV